MKNIGLFVGTIGIIWCGFDLWTDRLDTFDKVLITVIMALGVGMMWAVQND